MIKKIGLLLLLSSTMGWAQFVQISDDFLICEGQTQTAFVIDTDLQSPVFQWYVEDPVTGFINPIPGATDESLDISEEGYYQITADDGANFASDELFVFSYELPTPDLSNAGGVLCLDNGGNVVDPPLLDATPTNQISSTVYTYAWTLNGSFIADSPTLEITAAGSYEVTVFADYFNNGLGLSILCENSEQFSYTSASIPNIFPPASALEVCDDDTDGLAFFDLTVFDTEITAGDPTLVVTYYESQADIDAQTPIANPTSYQNNTSPQTVLAVVSNTSGCEDQTTADLIVLPLPSAGTPAPLVNCDTDSDGFSTFDLSSLVSDIINGESGVSVTFHETLPDAELNLNALPLTYINTAPFAQTLYARDTNDVSGCYVIVEVSLIVEVSIAAPPNDLNECDDNTDGLMTFDLTQNDGVVTGSQDPADLIITYYANATDLSNDLPIATPTAYINSSNPQIVYVQVENSSTNCTDDAPFELSVEDCSMDADGDGVPDEDEDINNNGNLDDDDTDGDAIPDYQDEDDDGDLVDTIDEITGIGAGFSDIDTDADGILNYLDDDDDGDFILTKNEDYNGNGSPLDDDTNANGIPDFLDAEVALGLTDYKLKSFDIFPNPTADHLNIVAEIAFAKASIYTLNGTLYASYYREANSQWFLDVRDLPAGIYFIQIEGLSIQKLIKK